MKKNIELIKDICFFIITTILIAGGIYLIHQSKVVPPVSGFSSVIKEEFAEERTINSSDDPIPDGYYRVYKEDMQLLKTYQEYNSDVVGYIRIKGTVLDHPLVHTPENEEYYLYRDLDKNYNSHGVPLLSYNSQIEASGTNMVIYGHNIHKNVSDVFCDLAEYEKIDFYKEHPIIETISASGTRKWIVFAYFIVDNAEPEPFKYSETTTFPTKESFNAYMDKVSIRNWLDTTIPVNYGDSIITLSSCSRELSGIETHSNRMVVMGRLLENNEDYESYVADAKKKENPLLPEKLKK